MLRPQSVTIGVPVYKGEKFVEETLRSLRQQTHKEISVLISIDGDDNESEERCIPYLKDPRFRLVTQPRHLGWVGNINWLMRQVETAYWCCIPQDDWIEPVYIERLLASAEQNPNAAVVYCDIDSFGGWRKIKSYQASVVGNIESRLLQLIRRHHSAVAFRGLTRLEAIRFVGDIRPNEIDSYSTDTVWMAAMARWGDLVRVPGEMYHKRYHKTNVHTRWRHWPIEKLIVAWIAHCADMLEQAMLVNTTLEYRRLFWLMSSRRLTSPRFSYLNKNRLSLKEREALVDPFIDHIQKNGRMEIPSLLRIDWSEINSWTRRILKISP